MVYVGRSAGSHYTHRGGGANYQCVTEEPENFDFGPGTVDASFMYGAEYECGGMYHQQIFSYMNMMFPVLSAIYVATCETVLMIPGRYTCPQSWTREYYGWLMATHYNHHRSTFECVDSAR